MGLKDIRNRMGELTSEMCSLFDGVVVEPQPVVLLALAIKELWKMS